LKRRSGRKRKKVIGLEAQMEKKEMKKLEMIDLIVDIEE